MPVSNQRRPVGRAAASNFNYRPRAPEAASARLDRYQKGNRDSYLQPQVDLFTPKEGDNWIRILPPTWENADHYAYELFVHYEVGPDNNTYLCLERMLNEQCPLCEELRKAKLAGEESYARALECGTRLGAWVLDRENENKGVLAWLYSPTIDREILMQSRDRRTGEVLQIDHPAQGFDVEFTRKGKGMTTKYTGIKLARQPSEVPESALQFITDTPFPNVLVFHDAAHIEVAFAGAPPPPARDEAPPPDDTPREHPEQAARPGVRTPVRQPTPAARQPTPTRAATPARPAQPAARATTVGRPAAPAVRQPTPTPAATGNAARRQRVAAPEPEAPAIDFFAMDPNELLNWADAHNVVIPDEITDDGMAEWLSQWVADNEIPF